jgi:hypothetical protein
LDLIVRDAYPSACEKKTHNVLLGCQCGALVLVLVCHDEYVVFAVMADFYGGDHATA